MEGWKKDDLANTYISTINSFKHYFKDWISLFSKIFKRGTLLQRTEISSFEKTVGIELPEVEQQFYQPIPIQRVVAG